MEWTELISADVSFQILGILLHLSLRAFSNFSFMFLLRKEIQMFVRNIGGLKIAVGNS